MVGVGDMIDIEDFVLASVQLGRDFRRDAGQDLIIRADPSESLLIKAGPGSGKTTVIVLKILKNIFVDNVEPSSILATTFTKKAAAELKSRILGWGDQMRSFLISNTHYSDDIIWKIKNINFNAVTIGTIDSIAQEILTDNRGPGNSAPIIIEPFVTEALMTRFVLLSRGLYNDATLGNLIGGFIGRTQVSVRDRSSTLVEIKERCIHDMIDIDRLKSQSPINGTDKLCDAIHIYNQELTDRLLFDYSRLENEFLTRLVSGRLRMVTSQIKYVIVDEYQDTNAIQEQIYFQLASGAIANGGSISVVGDDDQSIYHFRGATVELFSELSSRIRAQLHVNLREIPLSINYRSTQCIIDFCNNFASLDNVYQAVRLTKPKMSPPTNDDGFPPRSNPPVLGMFRDTVEELSQAMADLIDDVVNNTGFTFSDKQGKTYSIKLNQAAGMPSDIAILCSSPEEFDSRGNPRLPNLLRNDLQMLVSPLNVYNPRGQNLRTIPDVVNLCGMLLECIDPNSGIQSQMNRLPTDAVNQMNAWRMAARTYITLPSNNSVSNRRLIDFVRAWATMTPMNRSSWEHEVSLLDLTYKLVTWIPNMQNDIEGLVYLEAITRAISQAGFSSQYDSSIYFNPPNQRNEASIKEVINNIFVPIALGSLEVNEDLLQTIPPNRINIMSMHQAKGLEFPLVMVDIGSEFKTRHHTQEFKRFPKDGGKTCNIEDYLRPFSTSLSPISRSSRDRAFDDLYRKYFVGFSRARDILILVGLTSVRDGETMAKGKIRNIENVATGFDRNGSWIWRPGLTNLVQL